MASTVAGGMVDLFSGPPIRSGKYDLGLAQRTVNVPNPQLVAARQDLAQRKVALTPETIAKKAPMPEVEPKSGTEAKLDIPPNAFDKLLRGDINGAAAVMSSPAAQHTMLASGPDVGPRPAGEAHAPSTEHLAGGASSQPPVPRGACDDERVETWDFHQQPPMTGMTVHDGGLDIVAPATGGLYSASGGSYDNFTAEVQVDPGGHALAAYGLALRVQPDGSAVSVLLAQSGTVRVFVNGDTRANSKAASAQTQPGGNGHLRVDVLENRYDVWLDGRHVLVWVDERSGAPRAGGVALRVDGARNVRFSDLLVRRTCDEVTHLMREAGQLSRPSDAARLEQAYGYASTSAALSRRIADAWARTDPARAVAQYIVHVQRYGWEQGIDPEQLIRLAHGVHPLPGVPQRARRLVATAHQQLVAHQLDQAAASYREALHIAPLYADAWYGLALIAQCRAVADPAQLPEAAHAYDVFVLAASDGDPRAAEARDEADALRRIDQGLKAPATIQQKQLGSWPYGRSAFYVEMGFGAHDMLNDGGVGFGSTEAAGVRLPFLPRWSAGAFMHMNQAISYGAEARYALWSTTNHSGTAYTELHLDLGYGGASPNWGADVSGDATTYSVGLGLTVTTAWFFGIALSTGYSDVQFDRLTDNTSHRSMPGRDESFLNLLTVQLFSFGL
jgi:hypothetical protein